MNIKAVLWWVLAIVVAVGAWWFLANGSLPSSPLSEKAPVGDSSFYELTPTGDRRHLEETDTHTIDVTYPSVSDPTVQLALEAVAKEEVARFKADLAVMVDDAEATRIREAGRPYELIISYKPYTSPGFSSYEFDIYLDTGGAHPNAFFRTLTFNEAGEEVMLPDLFKEGARYLDRISTEAYKQVTLELGKRLGVEVSGDLEETVRIGTSPTPETLQFFYLSQGNLHIIIPPYQAASYAAGTFDVSIPLSQLEDILK